MKSLLRVCLSIILLGSCRSHYDPAYMRSADDGFTARTNWMAQVRDDVMLAELALPGTHGSVAYQGQEMTSRAQIFVDSLPIILSDLGRIILADINTHQALNIRQQLHYGIRVFDIRIFYVENEFGLMQGDTFFTHIVFEDVLDEIVNFLAENPSETVLFTLTVEKDYGDSKRPANERLDDYLALPRRSSYYLRTNNSRVTLGEARGKFIIFSRYSSFDSYGLQFYSSYVDLMDKNYLSTNWDLYDKWIHVKDHLSKANSGDSNKYYVTFLSGYGGSFPYFVASGHSSPGTYAPRLATGLTTPGFWYMYPDFPRVAPFLGIYSIVFEGTNILSRDKIHVLNNDITQQSRTVGIIIADFIGDSLIETTIQNNDHLFK